MLFKNYKLLHDGIDCGLTINGKTIDNYRPEDVARLIKGLPDVLQLMVKQNLQNKIMGESKHEYDESRRIFHYQPDFTSLKKSLKKVNQLPLYVYERDGEYKFTSNEEKIFKEGREIFEHAVTCPACDGRGIIGTDYCSVCWGNDYVNIKSQVVIIPCDKKSYNKLKINNIKELPETIESIRSGYPDWCSIKSIKSGGALSWDDLEDMC